MLSQWWAGLGEKIWARVLHRGHPLQGKLSNRCFVVILVVNNFGHTKSQNGEPLTKTLLHYYCVHDGVDHTFAGEPQEKDMMQRSSNFPLITKPRLPNPVGLGEGLARCQRCHLRQLTWTCTQSHCLNETERLSISPAC